MLNFIEHRNISVDSKSLLLMLMGDVGRALRCFCFCAFLLQLGIQMLGGRSTLY